MEYRLVQAAAPADFSDRLPYKRPFIGPLLARIKDSFVTYVTGKNPDLESPRKMDCWVAVYNSGEHELLTVGDVMAGTSRFVGSMGNQDRVTYLTPMRMVWH